MPHYFTEQEQLPRSHAAAQRVQYMASSCQLVDIENTAYETKGPTRFLPRWTSHSTMRKTAALDYHSLNPQLLSAFFRPLSFYPIPTPRDVSPVSQCPKYGDTFHSFPSCHLSLSTPEFPQTCLEESYFQKLDVFRMQSKLKHHCDSVNHFYRGCSGLKTYLSHTSHMSGRDSSFSSLPGVNRRFLDHAIVRVSKSDNRL